MRFLLLKASTAARTLPKFHRNALDDQPLARGIVSILVSDYQWMYSLSRGHGDGMSYARQWWWWWWLSRPPCLRQHAGGWRHPRSLPDLQSHGALLPVGLCAHSKQELLRIIASYTRIETKVAWK